MSLVVDVQCGETLPLKRSLAVRLGKVVDEEAPSQKGKHPKDCLQSVTLRHADDRECVIRVQGALLGLNEIKQVVVFNYH